MKKMNLFAIGVLVLGLSLSGCSKKQTVAPEDSMTGGGAGEVSDSDINAGLSDSDSGNAMGMQTVYFPFDSAEIVGENRETLKNNISILKENPTVNVQIEGHTDERGGIQYNLALGERRANSVRQQLLAAGISGSRITTISFGKEKPIAMGSGEDAWSKNRRANFVITAR